MDINKLLYDHTYTSDPKRGSLLIAEPLMREDIFSRSVVLILDKDRDQGHLGLVLNKLTNLDLGDLIPELELERSVPVFSGGPVDQSRLFMLHTLGDVFEGSSELIPGIYVGGKIEDIAAYLSEGGETEGKIRFFLGYSGWIKGQLLGELNRNVWALANDAESDSGRLLEGSGNAYWRREVELLGNDFRSWLVVPQHPSLN